MKRGIHWLRGLTVLNLVAASLVILLEGCGDPSRESPTILVPIKSASALCNDSTGITTIATLPVSFTEFDRSSDGEKFDRRALLIGCSVYPNLAKDLWLKGPSADVAITKDLLLNDRLGFSDSAIVTLVYENSPELQPTYENIVNHFERLIVQIHPGDQVFILLAGHGGQQPNTNADNDPEPDGLDELFVPQDVSGWNRTDILENRKVILDDQIGRWLTRMREAGALVFFVADSCHAGSLNRGVDEPEEIVRSRALPLVYAQEDLQLSQSIEAGETESVMDIPADIVTLFAVPAQFAAREQPMPPNESAGSSGVHGRLSYAFNEILRTARRPISYRELVQQLRWKHAGWNWSPFPYIEGTNLDRMVLGRDSFPDRSTIGFVRTDRRIELNIGSLHQVLPGTVLAVYPPAGEPDDEIVSGYVQVVSAGSTNSQAKPCEFGSHSSASIDQLPRFGRCEIVYRELGDARLPVMVIDLPEAPPSLPIRNRVKLTLQEICVDPRSLVRETDKPEECDIFIVVSANQVVLRRKYEPIAEVPEANRDAASSLQTILPFPIGEDLKPQLASRLLMISRALNLLRLAESETCSDGLTSSRKKPIDFKIKVQLIDNDGLKYRNVEDPTSLELHNGDKLRVAIANEGSMNVDVTGLVIESGFAIKPWGLKEIDASGRSRKLAPYQNRVVVGDESKFFELKINDTTLGMESLVLIAVPGIEAVPVNFDYLKQSGLEIVLSNGLSGTRGEFANRFQKLINSTIFAGSQTRGPTADDPEVVIRRVSWRVVK